MESLDELNVTSDDEGEAEKYVKKEPTVCSGSPVNDSGIAMSASASEDENSRDSTDAAKTFQRKDNSASENVKVDSKFTSGNTFSGPKRKLFTIDSIMGIDEKKENSVTDSCGKDIDSDECIQRPAKKRKIDIFDKIPSPPPKVIDLKGGNLSTLQLSLANGLYGLGLQQMYSNIPQYSFSPQLWTSTLQFPSYGHTIPEWIQYQRNTLTTRGAMTPSISGSVSPRDTELAHVLQEPPQMHSTPRNS